ncbi:hypothetical protein EWB00_004017 [Schistosoma japonicum]|uniref:Uncharacterized protein n=1 Tax=Schistosoma japonicum TaxID=6182 RepID=A0A4Z2DW28_SCHJA|nr:hypothetical protein EWB00_004017 [Schistosoma japonicum]
MAYHLRIQQRVNFCGNLGFKLAIKCMSFLESGKCDASQIYPVEQSIIQAWERQYDVNLTNPHLDILDTWSSDGGSISSSSSCCSDVFCMDPDNPNPSSTTLCEPLEETHFNYSKDASRFLNIQKHPLHYLKCAGVYTDKEVIAQAIDRWKSYKNLCYQALYVLRQQLVDAYIPYAIEESKTNSSKQISGEASTTSTLPTRNQRRQRAAQKMLHHSVKTANQRHLACVSKFAIVSNRISKWCKPTASQQCRFRDPTTTTWEKRCTNLCVPLLPVCSHHLVQMRPAPDYVKISSNELTYNECSLDVFAKSEKSVIEPNVNVHSAVDVKLTSSIPIISTNLDHNSSCSEVSTLILNKPIKLGDHIKSLHSRLNRSGKGHFDQSVAGNPNLPTLQISPQYLFRRCGGGPSRNCPEPVIAWNPFIRCMHHSTITSVSTNATPHKDVQAVAKCVQ